MPAATCCRPSYGDEERAPLPAREARRGVLFIFTASPTATTCGYIYSTFPIVERDETAAYGTYRSRDLCLAWMNALAAGDPDAKVAL